MGALGLEPRTLKRSGYRHALPLSYAPLVSGPGDIPFGIGHTGLLSYLVSAIAIAIMIDPVLSSTISHVGISFGG